MPETADPPGAASLRTPGLPSFFSEALQNVASKRFIPSANSSSGVIRLDNQEYLGREIVKMARMDVDIFLRPPARWPVLRRSAPRGREERRTSLLPLPAGAQISAPKVGGRARLDFFERGRATAFENSSRCSRSAGMASWTGAFMEKISVGDDFEAGESFCFQADRDRW